MQSNASLTAVSYPGKAIQPKPTTKEGRPIICTAYHDHACSAGNPLRDVADYFAYASALKFAEGQYAMTSPVSQHVGLPVNFQAEAYAK